MFVGGGLCACHCLSACLCACACVSVWVCIGEDGYAEYAERAKTHELKNIDQRVRTGDLSQVLSTCAHIYTYVYIHTSSSCGVRTGVPNNGVRSQQKNMRQGLGTAEQYAAMRRG